MSNTDAIQDRLVAGAQSMPDLIQRARAADPALAQQLEGKSLLASKSPWGTVAVAGVSWVSARYGFGWDEATTTLAAGVGVIVGSYVMRLVTNSPITGILRAKLRF